MTLGIARAVGRHGERAAAEDAGGGNGEKGAVDAAAVRDDQGIERLEPAVEGGCLGI
jgi:hypothetical protein